MFLPFCKIKGKIEKNFYLFKIQSAAAIEAATTQRGGAKQWRRQVPSNSGERELSAKKKKKDS
jgi:hypothetical protein